MSDIHNTFIISGDGNTVDIDQDFGSDGNEALALVLKFLVTILLSPVLIPLILGLNGYKLMSGNGQNLLGGDDDGDE